MLVSEVAKLKGITFEMVNQVLMVDYTTEDGVCHTSLQKPITFMMLSVVNGG